MCLAAPSLTSGNEWCAGSSVIMLIGCLGTVVICDPLGQYKNYKEGRVTDPSGPDEDYSDYNENSEEVRPGIGPGGQFPGPGMRPGIGPGRPGGPGQRPNPGRRTFQNENANYNYPTYLSK